MYMKQENRRTLFAVRAMIDYRVNKEDHRNQEVHIYPPGT